MSSQISMKTAKIGYIILSSLLCALGLMIIVFPEISVSVIGMLTGIFMILFSAFKITGYISKDLYRLAFQYDLAYGILLFVLGLIILLKPEHMFSFISMITGVAILADGLFKVQIAIDAKPFGIKNWWLILVLSLLSVAVGIELLFHPETGFLALATVFGVAIFFDGVLNLITVLMTVKILKKKLN